MAKKIRRETFKERYNFKCFKCKKQLWAKPSIMMVGFGLNRGRGNCPDCKAFFYLEIEGGLDGDKMICKDWDKYINTLGQNDKLPVKD